MHKSSRRELYLVGSNVSERISVKEMVSVVNLGVHEDVGVPGVIQMGVGEDDLVDGSRE